MNEHQKYLTIFKSNLLHLRKINNMTQSELSEKCNISLRKLQRLENGESVPSFSDMIALSEALHIDVPKLIDLSEYSYLTEIIDIDHHRTSDHTNENKLITFISDKLKPVANEMFNLDFYLKAEEFLNAKLPLSVSDFKHKIYNKAFSNMREQDFATKVPLLENAKNHFKFLAHTNILLQQKKCYFYSHIPSIDEKKNVKDVRYFGYYERNNNSIFTIITTANEQ